MSYYKVLHVDVSANQDVIKAAYRHLARRYHPDINKALNATAKMQQINEAYEVLKDPIKRARYDSAQTMPMTPKPEPPKTQPQAPKPPEEPHFELEHLAKWGIAYGLGMIVFTIALGVASVMPRERYNKSFCRGALSAQIILKNLDSKHLIKTCNEKYPDLAEQIEEKAARERVSQLRQKLGLPQQ